ncbi:MAG: serine/threonine-protein kinase [Pirellulaceae bacterium]
MVDLSRLGPFALENRLGKTQSSHVYQGFHLKQRRQAAIHILSRHYVENPRMRRRLERRSVELQALTHPNIVRCHGAGIDQGIAFLALDYVDGVSLEQYLVKHSHLPWEAVVHLGLQLASACSAAHEKGIQHLLVSPSHVLLTGKGLEDSREEVLVLLTNFWVEPRWRRSSLTAIPKVKRGYLSPEQVNEPDTVGPQSDIFSLGCVLYEAVTGKSPFDPLADGQQRWAPPERPASLELECPVWLDRVIMRMIEIDPALRPPTMESVASGLRESQDAVARGMSALEHALVGNNGRESIIDIGVTRTDAQKLLSRPKRQPRGPFYEHPLFLVACLLLVMAAVGWVLRPMNDKQLFAKAEVLMHTNDSSQWHTAETQYLRPLLERYPDSPYVDEARTFLDGIEIERAENRLSHTLRWKRDYRSDAERMLAEARNMQTLNSHVDAWRKYEQMVSEMEETGEQRPYHLIAQQELKALAKLQVTGDFQKATLEDYTTKAQELYDRDNKEEAREISRRIVSLYAEHPEARDCVKVARDILREESEKDDYYDEMEPLRPEPAQPAEPAPPADQETMSDVTPIEV